MNKAAVLTDQQADDLEMMRGGFGFYVGQLTEAEIDAFERLCSAGLARRVYRGAAGSLGLAVAERLHPSTN